jgi:hypothetical protein
MMMKSLLALSCVLAIGAAGCEDDDSGTASHDMAVGGGTAPTCSDYCTKIIAACGAGDGGSRQQYSSADACNSYCSTNAKWPVGTATDTSGNTLGCRSYHAVAAMTNPILHCPHAGPSGGNTCGSWCDNYCQLALANCTGANKLYDTTAACMTACAPLSTQGFPNDATGNTVQCRIFHVGLAGGSDSLAAMECPHGKVTPAAGDPCQ